MNSRLILVEGIPGAGKTTTARKIKEKLIDEGKEAIFYEEGLMLKSLTILSSVKSYKKDRLLLII